MGITIGFIVLMVLLIIAVPIGISLGLTSVVIDFLSPELTTNIEFIVRNMVSALDSYPLLAVPLFILSGIIMAKGGISKRLFDFFTYFIGNLTAGLPMAAIATSLFYGAISGSGPATTAAVGAMTIPILTDLGYDRKFSTAMVAVSGGLGIVIPPSIPFIIYGLSSSESVGALFIAGIIPGVLIGLSLMLYAFIYCKIHGEDKEKLNTNFMQIKNKGMLLVFRDSFFALLAPVIILGGIYSGIVTPTEAAVVSVVYALLVSLLIYRSIDLKGIPNLLLDAIRTAAPPLIVVATATVFGRILTMMQVPQMIAASLTSLTSNKIIILLIINLFLLLVGMVMETLAAILILTPIFLPIVTTIGVSPIHFGVIMVANLAIGFVTPPIGMNLYVASGMTGIPIIDLSRKAAPFIIAFFIILLLITFIPKISLLFV